MNQVKSSSTIYIYKERTVSQLENVAFSIRSTFVNNGMAHQVLELEL